LKRKSNGETIIKTVSAIELLQIALIVLKLCRVISWSWLWVLAPTWISAVIIILVIAFIFWILK